MSQRVHEWLWTLAAGVALAGCSSHRDTTTIGTVTAPVQVSGVSGRTTAVVETDVDEAEESTGLVVELSDGTGGAGAAGAREPTGPVATTPLDAARIDELLARVPDLPDGPARVPSFAFPADTLSPERPGEHVTTTVDVLDGTRRPPTIVSADPTAPLTVLRTTPSGEVNGPVSTISITFSAPMVPLTAITDLAALDVPVSLSPEVPGRWRWLGTSTLVFEAETRLPMASHITATVDASRARSVHGQALADDIAFVVSTAPPRVVSIVPSEGHGPQVRQPVIVITFDQAVDAEAVLEHLEVDRSRWIGSSDIAYRLATDEEREAALSSKRTDGIRHAASWQAWNPDTMVAVIPAEPLALETRVEVGVTKGVPAREGPRGSSEEAATFFHVHGALEVASTRCGWRGRDCTAGQAWQIEFTNPIDAASFDVERVTIEPPARIIQTSFSHDTLTLVADTRGNTTYEVTIDAELRDVFGQTLGEHRDVEFHVDPSPPELSWGYSMQVADPMAPRRFGVVTRNVEEFEVAVLKVDPSQWSNFWEQRSGFHDKDGVIELPGEIAIDAKVDVVSGLDERVITHVDLTRALDAAGLGHVIVCVRARAVEHRKNARDATTDRHWSQITWVQNTNLAVDATIDDEGIHAWVTQLTTGAPVSGATVAMTPLSNRDGTTNAVGLAHLESPETSRSRSLIARYGNDAAILNQVGTSGGSEGDQVRWVFVDDRHLYKPGETVRIKGWARRLDTNKHGDIAGVTGWIDEVQWTATDSRGVELGKGTTGLSARGGFDLSFELPEGVNLGQAYVRFQPKHVGRSDFEQRWAQHTVQVQEFRRPEFEVSMRVDEGPHLVGGDATATVSGRYFTGGALPDAEVTWGVTSSAASYAPPGWDEFTFGTWVPWWRSWNHSSNNQPPLNWSATTDAEGEHALAMRFVEVTPPRASTVSLDATITDVNRQAWKASSSFIVHPADVYVGVRTERSYLSAGEPIAGSFVVTDIDGAIVAGRPVTVVATLTSYQQKSGEWKQVEIAKRELSATSSADGAVEFELLAGNADETALGGRWAVVASVTDVSGRANQSERTLWAAGGAPPVSATDGLPFEDVELVPDRKEYEDGEVAKVLVQAPFAPAYGILTIEREGIVEERALVLDEPTTVLEIPITDAYVPNIHVHVELVGAKPRDVGTLEISDTLLDPPPRPAYAQGQIKLSVPPIRRALDIAVVPRDDELLPGASTVLDLTVTGHDGEPVTDAEVAVIVVDEALFALSGHTVPDPLGVLYPERSTDTRTHRGRAAVRLSGIRWDKAAGEWRFANLDGDEGEGADDMNSPFAYEMTSKLQSLGYVDGGESAMFARGMPVMADAMPESAAPVGGAGEPPVAMRTNFDAVAAFVPDALTDSAGKIAVPIEMPDSLTRYRIITVALDTNRRAGKAEGAMTVRLPLMVRPSAPRFLSWGDTCELPVVLQNGMAHDMVVDVALAASNAVLTEGAGKRVTVPANDRVELRFGVATADVGTAAFQFVASAEGAADAARVSFPVWTPATSETFAAVGVVDEGGVAQTVRMPNDVITAFGGLEVSTSSTALASLSDAFLYLYEYPYGCTEQRASRTLGTLAMLDVVDAWTGLAGMPSRSEVLAQVQLDVVEITARQHASGGFGWWTNDDIQPYLTVHATAALLAAREADLEVPGDSLERALAVLTNLPYDTEYERRVVAAYAASVLARGGSKPWGMVRDQLAAVRNVRELPADAVAWLLDATGYAAGALDAERALLQSELVNRVHESTSKAHITTAANEEASFVILSSDRRSDALATSALINAAPSSDVIIKLVRGLQGERIKGRWRTTQENVFVLQALRAYFDAYESEPPSFTATTWLADRFAGSAEYDGRTTLQDHIEIPLATVASLGSPMLDDSEPARDIPLVIAKEGRGRMYWRAALRTAPDDLRLDPADAGFTVSRVYEAVDDPDDVWRDADGIWHVRAGASVRVTVTMTTPMVRHHVALVDPLPGGFEAVNPAFASSPSIGDALDTETSLPWWRRVWYGHQNLRDERAEAFATRVWPGAHAYRYVARATTPGRFVAGPAKAEEMYEPETFGRGATDIVIVEPAN